MSCTWPAVSGKVINNGVCNAQVMFFVGVQLDITAPPTPKAIADLQAAPDSNAAVSGDPVEALTANAGAKQQTGKLTSSAASQQVQSQVFPLYQYQHSNMQSYTCLHWYTCILQFRQSAKRVRLYVPETAHHCHNVCPS